MADAELIRFEENKIDGEPVQTLGRFKYYDLLNLCTLELPWRDNKIFISRFPPGFYTVVKRFSFKHKWHWHITGVDGRTWILFHSGCFFKNTKGCVLVGLGFKDLNNDGLRDTWQSKKALKAMNAVLPKRFTLDVRDEIWQSDYKVPSGY